MGVYRAFRWLSVVGERQIKTKGEAFWYYFEVDVCVCVCVCVLSVSSSL